MADRQAGLLTEQAILAPIIKDDEGDFFAIFKNSINEGYEAIKDFLFEEARIEDAKIEEKGGWTPEKGKAILEEYWKGVAEPESVLESLAKTLYTLPEEVAEKAGGIVSKPISEILKPMIFPALIAFLILLAILFLKLV
jgi:hypothetical protein